MPRKILVVDDDPYIQEISKLYLEEAGYEVRAAADGYSALNAMALERFNLVILDISMPRLDGFETLEKIRNKSEISHTPVLMLTHHNSVNDVLKAIEGKISGYILKPPDKAEFVARVNKVFLKSSA